VITPAQSKKYVADFQAKLLERSAADPARAFNDVFNFAADERTVLAALCKVARSKGAEVSGPDGITCASVRQTIGDLRFAKKVADDLRARRYQPRPAKEIVVPHGGKERPVCRIPLVDRVVQHCAISVLEPIVLPRLHIGSSAYLPKRGPFYALRALDILAGDPSVGALLRGDIATYFPHIVHDRAWVELERHVADRRLLALIGDILSSGAKGVRGSTSVGVLPGAPISNLISNLYRDPLDKFIAGLPEVVDVIAYGDDFVVGVRGGRDEAEGVLAQIIGFAEQDLELQLAHEKTEIVMRGGEFKFLGHDIEWHGAGMRARPSAESVARMKDKLFAAKVAAEKRKEDQNQSDIDPLKKIIRGFEAYFTAIGRREEVERLTKQALVEIEDIR
jgi:RNA-directed DNA polymerase